MLVFPPIDEADKYYILPFFWLPEDTLPLRVRRDHVPYDVWERQGYLLTTEGNIFIKRDPAGNIKPDKEKSTEKIDGTVALIMALDRAIRCGNDTGDSIYDERDLLVL